MASNSTSDAEFYQQHRDDRDEWGEPDTSRPGKERLSVVISVRLTPDQEDLLRREAEAHDLSISAFLRSAGLERARRNLGNWPESPSTVETVSSGLVVVTDGDLSSEKALALSYSTTADVA